MRKNKRQINLGVCEHRHASFTPLFTSVDGMLATEFQTLYKMSLNNSRKSGKKPQPVLLDQSEVDLFNLRATRMCPRQSTKRWRSAWKFEDGSGLPFIC